MESGRSSHRVVQRTSVLLLGALWLTACSTKEVAESPGVNADSAASAASSGCGYEATTGTHSQWPGGYQSWVALKNVNGANGTDFQVLLDLGESRLQSGYQADFSAVPRGALAKAPSWLQWQTIPRGSSFQFGFIGSGDFERVVPYVISVNGTRCDTVAPEIALTVDPTLVTEAGSITLSAEATDNVAVRKVVFLRDGEILGEDWEAPYSLEVEVDTEANGRHVYTARAEDPSGNTSEDTARTLVAIGARFFGGATDGPGEDFATYFDQVTPEDVGKWGSVEATRDEYDFSALDELYAYAKEQGFPFKLHTLIWGQQQPSWLSGLSLEEQREEIEEWMSLLAERYGDAELVDVVNEPLHAPPSYAEALGGAGETGWDWVITSFELAREYFPKSELILNDYQILILPEFVGPYLEIIALLQERDLIDGIGEQAHFLERAELSVVEANLEALAATGLPIYISEFDVNFADDARQAARVRDLFSLFWANPSVLGVTHWGYLQGQTWRPNAYLVRTDGTRRPAFDWILCTLNEGEECDELVPEYVPEPWTGTEDGLTLEAEEYDEGSGIAALGDIVAYTDETDWIGYDAVQFQDTWDTFWVTYAKGNEDPGSISLHLDDLESDPVLEIELAPTGSWGSTQRLEVTWPSIAGEHDLYVRFNGGSGVANVDSLRFGRPETEGPNLIANGDFEGPSTSGWFGWNGSVFSITSALAHSGEQSLYVDRSAGAGVAAYNLTSSVTPGGVYRATYFVTITGAASAPVNVTRKLVCGGAEQYTWLANSDAVPEGEWVELSGNVTVPEDCELDELTLFVEGPPAGVDLYLDDVSFREPSVTNLVANGTFEQGTSGWSNWAGTLGVSTERARSGAQSLIVSNQGNAVINLTALVTPGQSYDASFWITIGGAATAPVNITRKIDCAGEDATYTWLANNGAIADGAWTELSGSLDIPDCELEEVLLYVEGAPAGVDVYVDDVVVRP